jgi:RNA polymerase sigma-70 factor (ECF subfamily)
MSEPAHLERLEWVRRTLDRHEAELLRYARHLTGDVEAARDVVQETFLRLCREDRAELDGHLIEWLFTVCRNQALDVKRKERRMATVTVEAVVEATSSARDPAIEAEQRDSADHVLELISQLPRNQQEVLRLKFQSGLSYREIAAVTGLSETNVGFLIHRGLKTVRERLG